MSSDQIPREQEPEAVRAAAPGLLSGRSKAALDQIFGNVLPDTTRDELDDEADNSGDRSQISVEPLRDRELRLDVPPHHG